MKNQYRALCEQEDSIPVFARDWWLDATAGKNNWDVATIVRDGHIVAALPFVTRRRYGLTFLTQPELSQFLGPWIKPGESKYARKLAREKELLTALVDSLPPFDDYRQNWAVNQQNWLPLYWKGYSQITRYTYRFEDLSDPDVLWDGLQQNIRGDIRKASSKHDLTIRFDLGIDAFLSLNSKTFARQGMTVPYSDQCVRQMDEACSSRACRQIFIAEDPEGKRHACVYLIWDSNSAYYLMGGGDPELRNSGATSLCIWEAIRFAATVTRSFDFEGSMIEPIEKFFRAFGATQTPYFEISKTPSRLLRMRRYLRDLANG